jgi:hypothetical protein
MEMTITLEWKNTPALGRIEVINGKILSGQMTRGSGRFNAGQFSGGDSGSSRLELTVEVDHLSPGVNPAMICVRDVSHPFTFFLRDVRRETPIVIPEYGVAVTTGEDMRTYEEIERAVKLKELASKYRQIDLEPEETFDLAAQNTRELKSFVWLGVSRDVRIFEFGRRQPMLYTDYVQPRFHGYGYFWPEGEKDLTPPRFGFVAGRGWHCDEKVRRRLDQDALPIVHVERIEEDIRYEQTGFVTLEKTPLTSDAIRGTHFLVADRLAVCNVLTQEEQKKFQALRESELKQDEETVFCCRIVAANTGSVPRYAFFKAPFPHKWVGDSAPHGFDREHGFGLVQDSDLVYAISKLNGVPLGQEEIAVLLQPGENCEFEFLIPHRPISQERARTLGNLNISEALNQCRKFWNDKLSAAGEIHLPEKRINDMVRAGLPHLDITAYGWEPDGPVAMTDGVYVALSSEMWVAFNYLDSLGLHALVRRCLDYYFEKQQDDGFIQTFTGYMLENGSVLLAVGEHYRYTHDTAWLRGIAPKIIKTVEYLFRCRAKAKAEGVGFGILRGQVADPVDQEQSYMLNAYAYAGLISVAEALADLDPEQSGRIKKEAEELKSDIRKAFAESLATGPVIPLGDGTWCPTASPWFGSPGPKCLFIDGQNWWTHGSMTVRDDIIGPMHLLSRGVFDPGESVSTLVLNYQNELMFSRNVASSQPYYSQHPLVHLRRGEVKRFLKTYYNSLAALADREVFTWWEHFYHESPHKTHEEAEFLMQTRWMLYLEDGETLKLLQGIPRNWLAQGKRIEVKNMVSYFGPLSFCVESKVDEGSIEIKVTCDMDRNPKRLEIRIPHPQQKKATRLEGGTYDADRETAVIEDFTGTAKLTAFF